MLHRGHDPLCMSLLSSVVSHFRRQSLTAPDFAALTPTTGHCFPLFPPIFFPPPPRLSHVFPNTSDKSSGPSLDPPRIRWYLSPRVPVPSPLLWPPSLPSLRLVLGYAPSLPLGSRPLPQKGPSPPPLLVSPWVTSPRGSVDTNSNCRMSLNAVCPLCCPPRVSALRRTPRNGIRPGNIPHPSTACHPKPFLHRFPFLQFTLESDTERSRCRFLAPVERPPPEPVWRLNALLPTPLFAVSVLFMSCPMPSCALAPLPRHSPLPPKGAISRLYPHPRGSLPRYPIRPVACR